MNEILVCSIYRTTVTGKIWTTWRETCSGITVFTGNPMWTGVAWLFSLVDWFKCCHIICCLYHLEEISLRLFTVNHTTQCHILEYCDTSFIKPLTIVSLMIRIMFWLLSNTSFVSTHFLQWPLNVGWLIRICISLHTTSGILYLECLLPCDGKINLCIDLVFVLYI
jgi:hypothetical protein